MNVLVISPHPDDEVLGCGGTILKHVNEGDNVFLCMVTTRKEPDWTREFIETKRKEVLEASNFLVIKDVYFLKFPTVRLDTVPQKDLNDALFEVLSKVKPEIVYIPFIGDLNIDHRIIFESSLVVLRPFNNVPFKIKKILSYEVLSSTEVGQPFGAFVPNIYVDISDFIEKKKQALSIYKSEVRKFPHPRSLEMIEILAKKRGSESGMKCAEAFMLIREIIR
jgi:LmbE family N-acetylglucosaminyl deacetylase